MADSDNPVDVDPVDTGSGAGSGTDKEPASGADPQAADGAGTGDSSSQGHDERPEPTTDEAPDSASDAGSGAPETEAPKADADLTPAELLAALASAREVVATAQDETLRARADTENVRRRSARDVENAHKFALEKFSKALIPVFESLEKAEASKGDTADAEAAAAVLEGVTLSLKLFKDTLEKQGISEIDPHGQPFDPNQHEAVAMIPMPAAEPNSVIEVIRKGYELNGRLIQAAQVVVSKADP